MQINVGKVSIIESEQIRRIYKRKTALEELVMSMNNVKEYEKDPEIFLKEISRELEEYSKEFTDWLCDKTKTNGWKCPEDKKLHVNFITNEVFYEQNENEEKTDDK
jgi:CXXX repeat modification system protein